ncbi:MULTISPECIES: hypothetical protein [unclassified Methanosarcina]|uniref:hypothetical protein n=1 Tax=unclassified Methanosarcina TaxID=2644672 RepID=UPI00064FA8CC|nr:MULTISPECIES: hypothetical protein [unclassified Methanosarcina]
MDEVTFGPVQILAIVFDNLNFHGQIRREFESIMDYGITEEDNLEITEAVPEGTATAILIIEHL